MVEYATKTSATTTPFNITYPYTYWPFGVISTSCFCFGVPANIFSLTFFIIKNKASPNHVSLLYIFINSVDLLISLLCLPKSLTTISGGEPLFFSVNYLCSISGYLWQILSRLSVFLVGLMSIYRTISLTFPFVRLSKRHIVLPSVLYAVILMVQQSVPWWYGKSYKMYHWNDFCTWAIDETFDLRTDRQRCESDLSKVLTVVQLLLPYIVPLFPIIISCLISIVKLKTEVTDWKSSSKKIRNDFAAGARKTKRAATMTIILLTIVYIVFNVPVCVLMICEVIESLSECRLAPKQSWYTVPYYFELYMFFYFYTVPLNSTVNPIVYILRIKDLNTFIWNVLRCKTAAYSSTRVFSLQTVSNLN